MESRKLSFLPKAASELFNLENHDRKSVMSPMTELSIGLEQSSMSTPRRRLSLNDGTPTPKRSVSITESVESGIEVTSPIAEFPTPDFGSPTMENFKMRNLSNTSISASMNMRRMMAKRSFSSPLLARKPLEALAFDSDISPPLKQMDSSFTNETEEKHSDLSLCEMSDDFPIEEPNDSLRLRKRNYSVRSASAPVGDTDNDFVSIDFEEFQSSCKSSEDDGFFEHLSFDSNTNYSTSAPSNITSLIDGPIMMKSSSKRNSKSLKELDKENMVPLIKMERNDDHVFRKPRALKCRSMSLSMKRDNPGSGNSPSPASRKKRPKYNRSQSVYEIDPAQPTFQMRPTPTRSLQRSQSFDIRSTKSPSVDITSLLDIDDKKLIGDKTKEYCLPVISGCKHPDLKGITPQTLAELMDNKYTDVIDEYHVIDSRYPYEFEGGHIKGALNIYEKSEMVQEFLKTPKFGNGKRLVLIFHCEFSSKRGPAMCRFLRNKDRELHEHCYPALHYPEMYLLEGGYKEFYAKQQENCEPQAYREMVDPKYEKELKFFSKRSKSWSEDKSSRHRHRTGLRY